MDGFKPKYWNCATQSIDERQPETDEIAKQFIPQDEACQSLYGIYREFGLPIHKAIANVLEASLGRSVPYPIASE